MEEKLTHYVAFLRGINVGGNNIIPMADLKKTFESLGLESVQTYIQSGNVLFKSSETSPRKLEEEIEATLTKEYTYKATVVVKSKKEMAQIIKNIPPNWDGNPSRKYNVLFLRHTIDSKKILKDLAPKDEIEQITYGPGALYWSALTSDLTRTSMVKLSSHGIYKEVTVRNINTTKKIFEIMNSD